MSQSVSTLAVWAAGLGFISAISLPIGVLASFFVVPAQVWVGGMAAFGGGALICALALELVAPHVQALEASHSAIASAHGNAVFNLLFLMGGGIIGGLLFIMADQFLNARGGFLRKYATSMAFISRQKARRMAETLRALGKVEVLRSLPTYAIEDLVALVSHRVFAEGEVIFEQGEPGEYMMFIKSGKIELQHNAEHLKTLTEGDLIGEIALLTGSPRTATAKAVSPVEVLMLTKSDFDRLRMMAPQLDRACKELAKERIDELGTRNVESAAKVRAWSDRAIEAMSHGAAVTTKLDIKRAHDQFHGSPMAVWLGTLIDGIPESFVIGTGILSMVALHAGRHGGALEFWDIVPVTFVGSLFLSNFPEAFSASITMRDQGYSKARIMTLWGSLAFVMAGAAAAGVLIGSALDPTHASFIEGLAGGAMLTMIASTMLPEAAHAGGPSVTGFATLLGFFTATAFKLFE